LSNPSNLTATLLVACAECGNDLEVEIVLAPEGPTRVHEHLCDKCIEELEERDGPAREPFTSEPESAGALDDDCPF